MEQQEWFQPLKDGEVDKFFGQEVLINGSPIPMGAVVGVILGTILLLCGLMCAMCKFYAEEPRKKMSSVVPLPGPPTDSYRSTGSMKHGEGVDSKATTASLRSSSTTDSTGSPPIRCVHKKVPTPESELAVPEDWKTEAMTGEVYYEREWVSTSMIGVFQQLVMDTFKPVKTRDRTSEMPVALKVIATQRVENTKLWQAYAEERYYVQQKRHHKCTPLASMGGEVKTYESSLTADLRGKVNEVYLWHGTSPKAAASIAEMGFNLNYSGTSTGSMYGKGIYLAECSSKSDEYAHKEADGAYRGLYCMLLCRVVLGEVLHLTVGGETMHNAIREAINTGCYDSVLGDREASVSTYREFVVYDQNRVYPEYMVMYTRDDGAGRSPTSG